MPPHYASESWGRGQRFGLVPLKDNRVSWFACQNTAEVHDPDFTEKKPGDLKKLFAGFFSPVQEILSYTQPQALLLNDILDLQPLPSFTRGRIVLLGDAAHATTPNMGQGASQALEDAAVLTSLLGKHPFQQAFSEYNRFRIPRAQQIVKHSWQLGRLAQWENSFAVQIRNMLMRSMSAALNQRQLVKLI